MALSAALETLSSDILYGILSEAPDWALALGLDGVDGRALPHAGFPDFSANGDERRARLVGSWARRLSGLADTSSDVGQVNTRPGSVLASPGDNIDVTRRLLEYLIEHGFHNRLPGRGAPVTDECADPLTALSGVHVVAMEMFARDHPLSDLTDARHYVERLAQLPRALQQTTLTLAERRARGLIAPRIVLERARAAIGASLPEGRGAHSFYRRLREAIEHVAADQSAALLEQASMLIEAEIRPQYAALLNELDAHCARAVEAISAGRRAGGEQFYAWRFAGHTTSSMAPESAHELGRLELERIHSELQAVFARLRYSSTVAGGLHRFAAEDAFAPSEAGIRDILEFARHTVVVAERELRPQFGAWPLAEVRVEAIGREQERSMHTHYVPGRGTSRQTGTFWLNLAQSATQPRRELAVVSYHETWPGHHLQMSVAARRLELPALRRIPLFTAYVEGWAKYAEGLAVDTLCPEDPLAQVAALRSELYSTATLVLDTGVHYHGWSFEEALRFFVDATGAAPRLADMVVHRSAANPGQLCAYKLGLLSVRALEARYRAACGPKFSVQAWHDSVLTGGALPLELLQSAVMARAPRRDS